MHACIAHVLLTLTFTMVGPHDLGGRLSATEKVSVLEVEGATVVRARDCQDAILGTADVSGK